MVQFGVRVQVVVVEVVAFVQEDEAWFCKLEDSSFHSCFLHAFQANGKWRMD